MMDFIKGALPFVLTGICLAIIFAANHKRENKESAENYLTEGMCIGIGLGVALSSSMHIDMGLGTGMGMLLGETVGFLLKKK